MTTTPQTSALLDLPIESLTAHPANLRFDLGDVSALTESIREVGLIEPIIVAPLSEGGYRIVAGHRRTAACQHAGLATVTAPSRACRAARAM
jgi:ParB family chromosome partitioning protein